MINMARRCLAEFGGTFCIVFCPVALAATGKLQNGDSSLLASALVSGLSVLAMIYAVGHISAAHFNPAVTLGFAVAGRFPWRFIFHYWTAQFAGALAASVAVWLLFGRGHGTHTPAGSLSQSFALEAILTFFLMFVIIAVATDR